MKDGCISPRSRICVPKWWWAMLFLSALTLTLPYKLCAWPIIAKNQLKATLTTTLWPKTSLAASSASWCITRNLTRETRPKTRYSRTLKVFTTTSGRTPTSTGCHSNNLLSLTIPPPLHNQERFCDSFRFPEPFVSIFSERAHFSM